MHARFNLDPADKNWSEYMQIGNRIHQANKIIVETDLEVFKDVNGVLQAKEIVNSWFPTIRAEVFLSHSHKDEKLVVGIAGWLSKEFGISSFIDSAVWGYSDKLLRAIDEEHCKNASGETFNYELRNRSTSHVHMMLATALMDMIDRTECIIFVNTPHSFRPADYLKNQGDTESPWIYSELAMTRLLRQKTPQEHRPKKAFDSINTSLEHLKEARELKVAYPADVLHLTDLTVADLDSWREEFGGSRRVSYPLDLLYSMKAA